MVLVTYDVNTKSDAGKRRLRNVAKTCKNYGQRVQFSVFECIVDPAQLAKLKNDLINIMDEEKDSIRIYHLGSNWKNKIEHYGTKKPYDLEGVIIL